MKKSRIIAIMLCLVMLFTVVACNKNNDTPGGSSPAGGDSTPAGGTSPADGGSSPAGGGSSPAGGGSSPAGGGSSPAGGGASSGRDDLYVALSQDSGTLDPLYNVGWDLINALRMLYEPLWEYEGGRVLRYVLAKEIVEVTPTEWLITLRDDVVFSNGSKFDAEDVLFSLWRANNREGQSPFLRELDYDACSIVDPYTVRLIWTEPSIAFMGTFGSIFMFDKETYDDATSASTPIGTGPYKVVDYVIQSHLDLEARSDYWAGTTPPIPNLHFRMISEEAQRVNALQTGEVDIAQVPFQDITYVQGLPGLIVDLWMGNFTSVLHMNPTTSRNVFSELPVEARFAIAHAIDREAIVDIAYDGFAEVSRAPLSAGTTDIYPALLDMGIYGEPNYAYNPDLARQEAIDSGLVNYTPLCINNGSATNSLISEMIQSDLKAIGVNIEVLSLDSGSWLTYAFDETQWDMAVDFTFGDQMGGAYRMWARMIGGYMTSPWPGSERFVEIVDTIMQKTDQNELNALYMELTQIHTAALPWFTLCDTLTPTAYNSDLKGWAPMLNGSINYIDLSW